MNDRAAARLAARAIRQKEWAQILLDPSTFGLVIVLPLLLMFLFGSAVSLDSAAVHSGIVDLDRSASSRDLVASFANNEHFAIREAGTVGQLDAAMVNGDVRGIIVIPDGFERGLVQRKPLDVQVIADGSQPNTATFVAGYARGVLAQWSQAQARERGRQAVPVFTLDPRYVYNPGLESRFMLVPGAISIVMAMIGCLLTALIMAREYERGTMEGLLSTPVSVPSLVINKLLPYYVLGLASTGICVVVAVTIYHLPFHGSLLALFVIVSAFLAAVLGQGLLISAVTKSQFVSTQISLLFAFLPSLLLSGFLFEIDSMPRPIQLLTYIVPARYLVPPLQSVFLVGDVWDLFLPNIAVLLGFGLFFFSLVTRVITRRIA
jgi:ABC-2 type transport system permease protein